MSHVATRLLHRRAQRGLAPLVLALLLLLPSFAHGQTNPFAPTLQQAWTWMEAGGLDRADAAFKSVVADPQGRLLAEAHFGLAAVWWQKKNAMASYQRLIDTRALHKELGWDPGESGLWDRRIEARIEYIERNFTVIKLKAASKASVPPLADPPPIDPLLREFTDGVGRVVTEALDEGQLVQYLLLPNGLWWVGDAQLTLGGGQMDPSKAETWELVKRTGATRTTYDERLAASAAKVKFKGSATTAPEPEPEPAAEEAKHRAFAFGVHGGLAPVRRLSGLTGEADADWMLGVTIDGRLPLPLPALALTVGAGWSMLPVNGCRVEPTRTQLVALRLGPSLRLPLKDGLSLGLDVVLRGGLAVGGRSEAARQRCAALAVGSELNAGAVQRGAILKADGATGVVSLADLGWEGRAVGVGAEAAFGPVIDAGGPIAFSIQLLLGYDQIVPVLPSDGPETVWVRDPETGAVGSVTRAQAASSAAMGRAQLGLRARLLF